MIAEQPTTATSSGDSPVRIAGITNISSSAKLRARPAIAVRPRHRPNATIAKAASMSNQTSGLPRWCSMTVYSGEPAAASVRWTSTTSSPECRLGAPGPCGRSTLTSLPRPVPELMLTVAEPHRRWAGGVPSFAGSFAGHGSSTTLVTSP